MEAATRLQIAWDGEGSASIAALDGETIRLVSSRPFAPGSRPMGTLDGGFAIRLKVHRSKKTGEAPPTFNVEGRLLEARRDLLAEIRSRLAPEEASPSD